MVTMRHGPRLRVRALARDLLRGDDGQDLIEYALLTGMVTVGFATVFSIAQGQLATAYQTWMSQTNDLWVPPPPL
jgi:Flp pilus assembly pilin Flp